MKSDDEVKRDVEAELKWNPQINEIDIAVKVNAGEVTLTGFTGSYYEKHQAEVIGRRVAGVMAIANDIQVKPAAGAPSDPEIARAALTALQFALPTTYEHIKPTVAQGRVTLEGELEWQYLREKAENAIRHLDGVINVVNSIRVKPRVAPVDIKHRIEDAFRRIAEVDAMQISVDADGSEVTLRGEVRSWAERDQAQQTAWSAPGVSNVKNTLTVRT